MEENITIANARYVTGIDGENVSVSCDFNGIFLNVPISEGNIHYAEIMRQVEAGDLTIAAAE